MQCSRLPSQKVTALRHSNKTDLLLLLLHCLVEQRVPLQLPYCHLSKAAVHGLQNVSRPSDSIAFKIQKALTDREVPGPTSTMYLQPEVHQQIGNACRTAVQSALPKVARQQNEATARHTTHDELLFHLCNQTNRVCVYSLNEHVAGLCSQLPGPEVC